MEKHFAWEDLWYNLSSLYDFHWFYLKGILYNISIIENVAFAIYTIGTEMKVHKDC